MKRRDFALKPRDESVLPAEKLIGIMAKIFPPQEVERIIERLLPEQTQEESKMDGGEK